MKFKKSLVFSVFILMLLSVGSAFAETCYDPRYGNYVCYPSYSSYPDQGQTFVEGAVLGLFLGGSLSNGGYEGGHWGGGHGHWGGGGHRGGGHGGGHHH